MTDHLLAWDERDETVAENGVAKRTIPGAGASLVRIVVPAGTSAARHSHAHEQFVQVLSGSGILETEQGRAAFGPGSVFHFPAEAWHAAEFETETVLVEINVSA
ncbi:cupin domain-containing protein [Methylobacterium sp. WL30]|uniref:cupin domain-containing protein n=1 Tax=unclassified Methylobacterium TaxID=2615210 RepID=UPI0011CB6A2C|nr:MULTISPECIES: cupin domain-containing protein [unclassified Methylobacterium]TXM90587.1 cupin domain-containing protein [Methylobacterium sp. WL116]TXN40372.1 cupin domain-containing protein [Methylobacterium sp. WL93]TXN52541.1 cupin domain-containing protein [Methylobacterium sp. WL119]TXN67096.1 cupin domain-containing protein [Methylobacterium sp. WL30]